ncbi:MAG: hypothetical protein PHX62_02675 [Bacilli bacterium]|nr:hypothetical protein [Bacilli bacterium]
MMQLKPWDYFGCEEHCQLFLDKVEKPVLVNVVSDILIEKLKTIRKKESLKIRNTASKKKKNNMIFKPSKKVIKTVF